MWFCCSQLSISIIKLHVTWYGVILYPYWNIWPNMKNNSWIDPRWNMATFCGIAYWMFQNFFCRNYTLYVINHLSYKIGSGFRLNYLFCLMILGLFSRWDIIAERVGFMLVFGDLVWIPFTFSIQACGLQFLNKKYRNRECDCLG